MGLDSLKTAGKWSEKNASFGVWDTQNHEVLAPS